MDEPSRRQFVIATLAAGLAAGSQVSAWGRELADSDWRGAVQKYLQQLAREDGGYGWDDQQHSHLTPTFAVIGCYKLLDLQLPNVEGLAEFVRTHHPAQLKKLEQEHRIFSYQQAQCLYWLGADASSIRREVASWKRPLEYMQQYEKHGYPVFSQEVSAIVCRKLLELPLDELPPEYVRYLDERRRADGCFNNTPASDGSDGNILNTWWGLRALGCLNQLEARSSETIEWLRACQLPRGGFTHQPDATIGAVDDVAYTWAAVSSLAALDGQPFDRAACVAYLRSLFNTDGGCSDRPGWASNPLATYYVLDALGALGELENFATAAREPPKPRQALPPGLKVFSLQLEAHGQGSPAEAVKLAKGLNIHLWGAKNAKPEWLASAQAIADEQAVPVTFFISNEEYGTWVSVPGMGTYSHTSDIVGPANRDLGPSLAKAGVVDWTEYRERRIKQLNASGGRLLWQFGENEPLVRLLLDDSLERGGFAAISTFHFGNPDFINSEPFLKRYRMQLPFVALQDAHGSEPWWFSDMTEGFRTLFLATEPTWEGWLNALENNWVVAVRRDTVTANRSWMHGGPREVLDFVEQHSAQWQWWENDKIRRPLVSLVALQPNDQFEAGSLASGVALRVRCAWQNTPQGLARQPITEFVRLVVNGRELQTELFSKKRPNGLYEDHYHFASLPQSTLARQSATVTVRHIASGMLVSESIEF